MLPSSESSSDAHLNPTDPSIEISSVSTLPSIQSIPGTHPAMEFWAFLENSDFQRRGENPNIDDPQSLRRWDEVAMIRHDEFLESDYQLMVDIGCTGIRDAARWYLTHTAPGKFDWTWMDRMVAAADKYGLKLYIDLWHYGYPDWLDILSDDAPKHFAEFAQHTAIRYPSITHYCVCNEPSLMVEMAGRQGEWRPFLKSDDVSPFRQQIARMIIEATKAIRDVKPDAVFVIPEPWHATDRVSEDEQAAVLDTVMGVRDPQLGGKSEYVTVVGLNHYRDSTLPPFHRLILNARKRWVNKEIWVTETSGPPTGWQQAEWFWWMMAEVRLAATMGAYMPVFTWAPVISMYDWVDDKLQLHNGLWIIEESTGERKPNGSVIDAIRLAREYGYIR